MWPELSRSSGEHRGGRAWRGLRALLGEPARWDPCGRSPCPTTCACLFCAFMVGAEWLSCRRKPAERKWPKPSRGLRAYVMSDSTEDAGGCDGVEVSFASRPGSLRKPNEDFVAASPSVAVVLDGLSAPPPLGTGCLHGTPWFVTQLGTQLVSAATTARDKPLQNLVASAISRVADSHADTCDLHHPGTPSSSLAVLREQDQVVEYLLLFDSVIVLDGPSGLTVVTDRRVDAFAQQEHLATREHPIGSPAHQDRVQELVAAQRRHRNQPGGYWVAGAQPAAAHQAVTGSQPHGQVSRVALLSDGVSCLVELYAVVDWPELLTIMQQHGPTHVLSRVREVEDADPKGARWPRYKRSDDATAALCLLG
jgi:hypothetical protein